MIFATAGTQLPFDRFVEALDKIAQSNAEPIVVQALPGSYEPRNFKVVSMLSREDFERHVQDCSVMVAHAGMGSILDAARHSKPLVVFPRRKAFGEQRNDHQLATARQMEKLGYALVAQSEEDLRTQLSHLRQPQLKPVGNSNFANLSSDFANLSAYIRRFIQKSKG